MKRFIILITSVIYCCILFAAPIYNMPMTLIQPDSSVIHCFASGDEYLNWIHDEEGYIIMQNPQTGYYCYADTLVDGMPIASDRIVSSNSRNAGYVKSFNGKTYYNTKQKNNTRTTYTPHDFNFPQAKAYANGGQVTINNIAVFIRFADQIEFPADGAIYNRIFNTTHIDSVSVKKYFLEASYNQLSVNNYFPQISGNMITSYQDSHNRSYYCKYDASTNPNGYTDNNLQSRKMTLFVNALNSVKTTIENEFTASQLDADNDGYIDNICIIVNGGTEPWAQFLWPHKSYFTEDYNILNKKVGDYNVQIRNHLDSTDNSYNYGVICHEFNHTLGAPDLYHMVDNYKSVGSWCLMGNTKRTPCHISSYIKTEYNHWFNNIPEITEDGTYHLLPLSVDTNSCYKISLQNSNEFLILEYRKKEGLFDVNLNNSGLLIYRINPNYTGNFYGYGYGGKYDEVYLYRLDGNLYDNIDYIADAEFCYESGRTEFHNSTNPNCFLSDGSLGNITIYNISSCGETISFSVCFCEEQEVIVSNNNNLPYLIEASYIIKTHDNVYVNNGDSVTFRAGSEILLNDAFEVKRGGTFVAEPSSCPPIL